jgi:hypothetical protein
MGERGEFVPRTKAHLDKQVGRSGFRFQNPKPETGNWKLIAGIGEWRYF